MPGPGEYVSKDGVWEPAMRVLRSGSPNKMYGNIPGDVLLRNEDGTPKLVPDPAAVESIQKAHGKDAKVAPVTRMLEPEPQKIVVVGNTEDSAKIAALEAKVNELLSGTAGQAPEAPKRRGRPPKIEQEG